MKGRIKMAEKFPYLCKGAKITCDKASGEIRDLITSEYGLVVDDRPYMTIEDNEYIVSIPPFSSCTAQKTRLCEFKKVKWLEYEENTEAGEGKNPLTILSYGICSHGGTITIVEHGQPTLAPDDEAEWIAYIKEKLRSLEAEYIKALRSGRPLPEVRAEFREKYMQVIKEAFEHDSPGAYDRLLKGIEDHCNEMRTEYWDKGKDATKYMKEEEKERFAKLALEFAKLQEKYTDIPWQVYFAQTCSESGYGGSEKACTVNNNIYDKNGYGELYHNLFGELVEENGVQVGVNFDSYEKAIANYLLKFRTHGVTEVGGTGVFTDLYKHDREDPDVYKKWYYDLANGTESERQKEEPTSYCMDDILKIPDAGYEDLLIDTLKFWDERGLYKKIVLS